MRAFSTCWYSQHVLGPSIQEPWSLFREEVSEHGDLSDRAQLTPRGVIQGGWLHSLWRLVAGCVRTHFPWVSSNCFCSCGFLLNKCIIRSHMAKPRQKTGSTLSSSSVMSTGTLGASSFYSRCETGHREPHTGQQDSGWQRPGVSKTLHQHSRRASLGTLQPVRDLSLDTSKSKTGWEITAKGQEC